MSLKRPKYELFITIFLALFVSQAAVAQFTIPEKPKDDEQHFVYDYIDLIDAAGERALENKLTNYADSTSTQIVIAIISTTKGEDISFLGAKWGQKWGIGQADTDNGILILLAKDDRTVDINTGYGIEYRITDRMAEQVINRYMIPEFKKGDFYGGLDTATNVLIEMLNGEFKGTEKSDFPLGPVIMFAVFLLFLLIIIGASKKGGGKGGHRSKTGSLLDVIILSNMGRTGGWGSSGSLGGGSFGGGGFGGGGFGGGGASGSW